MKLPLHLLRAATADPGLPLDRSERSFFEKSFAINLEDVRIHRTAGSLTANRAMGSLAFAINGHICMRPGFDASLGPIYSQVLAHELAHVAQKRHGIAHRALAQPASVHLEAEAAEIASQVLAKRPVTRITPDPSPEPRCWGPAGHYWTVYLASMMAGLTKQESKDNAFYAQMPDQVDELDATDEGEWFYPNYALFVIPGDSTADRLLRRMAVQKGLHALTGWAAENETTYRTNILKTLDAGTFEFALALHPFGDSFAHRTVSGGARMYTGPAGHAVEAHASDCAKTFEKGSVKAACFDNAYAVDNLNRRNDLYVRYGLAMYNLLKTKWASDPVVSEDKMEEYLGEISDETTERSQILKIAAITAGATGELHGDYDPDLEPCVPWKKFHAAHPWLNPTLLDKALHCAADWSGCY